MDELGSELSALAATAPSATPGAAAPERPSRPRRTAITLAVTGAVVVGLGTLPWVAERTERLSPLDAPVANAAAHAGRPGIPPASGYDLARSRTFPTPDGLGFVVNSNDGRRRCLVLPDRLIPYSFGSGCRLLAAAERDGILGMMVAAETPERRGRTLAAFVLPRGASPEVRVTSGGKEVWAQVANGVAVTVVGAAATIHYRVRGRARSERIAAPFRDLGKGAVQCADGRMVEFELPPAPPPGTVPAPLNAARFCD